MLPAVRQGAGCVPQRLSRRRNAGRSTLVQIVEANEDDRAELVEMLAQQLSNISARRCRCRRVPPQKMKSPSRCRCAISRRTHWSLCTARSRDGETREAFRTLHARGGPKPLRAFSFLEVEGEDEPIGRRRSADDGGDRRAK